MTAQHLRELAQPQRAATMAAAVIRLETELADAALLMFDKLMGGLVRKSERGTMESAAGALRDAQSHIRVLKGAGRAMIAADEGDADRSRPSSWPWVGHSSSVRYPRRRD